MQQHQSIRQSIKPEKQWQSNMWSDVFIEAESTHNGGCYFTGTAGFTGLVWPSAAAHQGSADFRVMRQSLLVWQEGWYQELPY